MLYAHPHTFVELYSNIKKEKDIIKINIQCHFDEMTSQMIIMDFDTIKDFKFDKDEVALIKKEAFDHLSEYNYYTFISAKGKVLNKSPQDFTTYIKDDKVVYEFNYKIKATAINHNLNIEFKDEDFFIAFVLKNKQIKADKAIKYRLKEIDTDYYFAYRLELFK
jgi:ABC-type uncharacterized transport system substrate-binding protein